MNETERSGLERSVEGLRQSFERLADDSDMEEFLKIIRRPGWTTVAENFLVHGLVDIIESQVSALAETREFLIAASNQIGVGEETERGDRSSEYSPER
jgi:hypothetical protein